MTRHITEPSICTTQHQRMNYRHSSSELPVDWATCHIAEWGFAYPDRSNECPVLSTIVSPMFPRQIYSFSPTCCFRGSRSQTLSLKQLNYSLCLPSRLASSWSSFVSNVMLAFKTRRKIYFLRTLPMDVKHIFRFILTLTTCGKEKVHGYDIKMAEQRANGIKFLDI